MSYSIAVDFAEQDSAKEHLYSFNESNVLSKVNHVSHEPLTTRELQVLSLWLLGLPMAGVGTLLQISHRTVESHLHNSRIKLQSQSRIEVLFMVLRCELYDDLVSVAKGLFKASKQC